MVAFLAGDLAGTTRVWKSKGEHQHEYVKDFSWDPGMETKAQRGKSGTST